MLFAVDEEVKRRGKSPHELAMVNLLLFNLAALIALLAGSFLPEHSLLAEYKSIGVVVPLLVSLCIMGYTWVAANDRHRPWYVSVHWRLTVGRYKILLAAYLAGLALISIGWLLAQAQPDPRMAGLMFIALQRVAIAPLLIVLMVLIMLESGSIYQAGRGEVPEGLVRRCPPPPEITTVSDNAVYTESER